MKELFFSISLCFAMLSSYGQSYYLSQTYISAMSVSYKIRYYSGSYSPSYSDSYYFAIRSRQAAYNAGRETVQNELYKLYYTLDDILISKCNRPKYNNFVAEVKAKANTWGSWDLSYRQNVDALVNYITQIYNWESIKAEIKLVQSCDEELNRIKSTNPDDYIYSKRYKAICKTMQLLENCTTTGEIYNLSWESTELKMSSESPKKEYKLKPYEEKSLQQAIDEYNAWINGQY